MAYGIQAAAKVYFNKTVDQLNLAECTMLAPIPQFPIQNPIDSPNDAKLRQELALDAMLRDGYITAEEAVAAKQEKLQIKTGGVAERFNVQAPHYSVYVRKWLEDKFGAELVNRGGLKVYTTLDLDLQNYAQQAIADQIKKLTAEGHNANNGATVAIRPTTGEILAMVAAPIVGTMPSTASLTSRPGCASRDRPSSRSRISRCGRRACPPRRASSTCGRNLRSPARIRRSMCRRITIASITAINACAWPWHSH